MRPLPVLMTALLLAAPPALAQIGATPNAQPGTNAAPAATAPATAAPTPVAPTAATPGAAPSAGHKPAERPDRYHATLDERIQKMHQRLRITPPQEDAWNGFAQVMRDNANAVEHEYQRRAGTIATISAADNLRDYAKIEQDRAQGVQHLSAAFDKLYGQLSDPQKKTADTMFRRYDLTEPRPKHARAKPQP